MSRNGHNTRVFAGAVLVGSVLLATCVAAQKAPQQPTASPGNGAPKPAPTPVDYVIGVDDILTVAVYGQDPKYSGDVTVRPDGKITLLLVDEVRAAGFTPIQLRAELTKAYSKFFQEPVIHVSAKEIRSRKVFITGMVMRPGYYYLNDSMNVVQLITIAGGLHEFASKEDITILRQDPLPSGAPDRIIFNYSKIFDPKSKEPIPILKPGDQVVVR